MREQYPGALQFLAQFEPHLRKRAAYKRYYTREDPDGRVIETGAYWSMFDVGDYTLSKHKVVWKDQAADFAAAVLSSRRPIPLPNHKVMLAACASSDEAHFICGLLNSVPARTFISAYTVETQISTHVLANVHVPQFDKSRPAHMAVAKASKAAHEAVAKGEDANQGAVDTAAGRIWGLSKADVAEMQSFLNKLLKRDLAAT